MNIINTTRNDQINKGFEPCFATCRAETCGQYNCSHREECLFHDSKITDQNDYIESVFGHIADHAKKDQAIDNALKTALEIRKFEIDLYWKRATYFWVFITASFAGFFWALQQEKPNTMTDNILFIMPCLGLSASWAWCLVLRGSKYWQENWEKHVDYLENYSSGKLYKYVKSGQGINRKDMLAPYPYSVSKINSLLGLYIFAIWAIALIYVTYHLSIPPRYDRSTELSWYMRSVFAGLAVSFIAFSAYDCRTKNSENILTTKSAFYCREETFHRTDAYNEDKLNKQIILLLLLCLMSILWLPRFM